MGNLVGPKGTQKRPITSQESPKWSPGHLQSSQNGALEPPRAPKMNPKNSLGTEMDANRQKDSHTNSQTDPIRNFRPQLNGIRAQLSWIPSHLSSIRSQLIRIRIKLTGFRIQRSRFRMHIEKKNRIQLSGIRIQLSKIRIEMSGLRIPFELRPTDRQTEFPSTELWPLASGLWLGLGGTRVA